MDTSTSSGHAGSQSNQTNDNNQDITNYDTRYEITDADGNAVLIIEGPWCRYSCFGSDVDFKIMTPDEKNVGKSSGNRIIITLFLGGW